MLFRSSAANSGVIFKPLADLKVDFSIELLWRKGDKSAATRAFVQFMVDYFQKRRVADRCDLA